MANPEHVAVVKRGREAIAEWRRQRPEVRLDLSKADLGGAYLSGADLSGADLGGADLGGADLGGANLLRADLFRANLRGANLGGADLVKTDLSSVDLRGANLGGADLGGANLRGANLRGANLSGANLHLASFYLTGLADANFSGAKCEFASFADCDLGQCRGLEEVVHDGPSSIGVDTLMRSKGQIPLAFLRGAGVPEELIAQLPRILAEVKYCICFICYGEPDKAFAEKLRDDLMSKGVRCWFHPKDATPGLRTQKEIKQKRQEAEKMVVLCSAPALVRDGVLKEIEEQIDEDPDKMVPVSLDNLWKERGFRVVRGDRDLKPFLLDRNYADFTDWQDARKYQKALDSLLKALAKETKPAA